MRKFTFGKKAITMALAVILTAGSLTGCDGANNNKATATDAGSAYSKEETAATKVMKIGDYDIYLDEVILYAIQELVMQEASPKTLEVNESTYKLETLNMIRERVILYNVAKNNDVVLEEDDLEAAQKLIDNFKSIVPQAVLDEYGISDELIERVFQEQACIEKFQNDIQNQMGEQIYDDFLEVYADYSFHETYYMVFPTVEVNEDGSPKTTGEKASNGDAVYAYLSDAEKAEVKAKAEAALAEIRDGKDPETVAKEYGVADYSTDRTGYVGMYDDEMNQALGNLKTGDCTDVMESSVGYTITYMKSANDTALKENYVFYLASQNLSTEYETLRQKWLATIPVDPESDMEGDVWENYSLSGLVNSLVKAGVLTE